MLRFLLLALLALPAGLAMTGCEVNDYDRDRGGYHDRDHDWDRARHAGWRDRDWDRDQNREHEHDWDRH